LEPRSTSSADGKSGDRRPSPVRVEAQFGDEKGTSPIRHYTPMEKNLKALKEDPAPLSSMTFPAGDGAELVVVFQQRMTHWVTIFLGEPCPMTEEDQLACDYTALPDK